MKRVLKWFGSFIWNPTDQQTNSHVDDDEAVVEIRPPIVKRDLIDTSKYPIVLPYNFNPQTIEGWNFMVRTLGQQKWLTYYSMQMSGFLTDANGKVYTEPLLKIESIAMDGDKTRREDVNHAILHDIKRPVINYQFYPEVFGIFSVYMRPIYCRHSVITLLCIRKYRVDEGLLYHDGEMSRTFRWLPKEIIAMIGQYLWATRREQCWDR